MQYRIINLGCKVNQVESDGFAATFNALGAEQGVGEDVGIALVNTCAVTSVAEKKTRKSVRKALSEHPHARVIVTGCAAVMNPDLYTSISPRVSVVPKNDVDDEICRLLSTNHIIANADMQTSTLNGSDHARVGVKIQDGCQNGCTYCIVWKLRGPLWSAKPDDIVTQVSALTHQGINEIVLTGINIGKYRHEETNLTGLLKTLLALELPCRFRISSIEPQDIDVDLIELVSSSENRICSHFHIPLQAGSSKVLKRMNRRYTKDDYISLIDSIRAKLPTASISTDVIVGFPGETEDDFNETLEVCESSAFSRIHVFPYSVREGTLAAKMDDQIESDAKASRAKILRALSDRLRQADLESRKGSKELAIVEPGGICMTDSYHEIQAPPGTIVGELVEVRL